MGDRLVYDNGMGEIGLGYSGIIKNRCVSCKLVIKIKLFSDRIHPLDLFTPPTNETLITGGRELFFPPFTSTLDSTEIRVSIPPLESEYIQLSDTVLKIKCKWQDRSK